MTATGCTVLRTHASSRVGVEKGIAERLAEWKASGEATGKELREIFLDIRTAGLEAKELLALEDDVDACFDKVKWTEDELVLLMLYRAIKETCSTIKVQRRLSFGFGVAPIKKLASLGEVRDVTICESPHSLCVGSELFASRVLGDCGVGYVIPKDGRPPLIIPISDINIQTDTTFNWLYRKIQTFLQKESEKGFFLTCPLSKGLVFDLHGDTVHWASEKAFGAFGDRAELTKDSHPGMVKVRYAIACAEYTYWEFLNFTAKYVTGQSTSEILATSKGENYSVNSVCSFVFHKIHSGGLSERMYAVVSVIQRGIQKEHCFSSPAPLERQCFRSDTSQIVKQSLTLLKTEEPTASILAQRTDFVGAATQYVDPFWRRIRPPGSRTKVFAASAFLDRLADLERVAAASDRRVPTSLRPLLPRVSDEPKEIIGQGSYGVTFALSDTTVRKAFRPRTDAETIGDEYAITRLVTGLIPSMPNVGLISEYTDGRVGFDMERVEERECTLGSLIRVGESLARMHALGIVHNDVYPKNVVGDQVIDFGFARVLGQTASPGQCWFMPLEVSLFRFILKKKFPSNCFVDSWSFGALLYLHWTKTYFGSSKQEKTTSAELLFSLVSFCSKTAAARREALHDAIVEEGEKDAKADILFKLLHPNPSERMLVKEAVTALEALKESETSTPKEGAAGGGGGEG